MLLNNNGKEKVIEFLNLLKSRNQKLNDERVERFLKEAFELVENNEYGVGLENILENLYEFGINLNQKQITTAKEAIQKMNLNWEEWKFIENLK